MTFFNLKTLYYFTTFYLFQTVLCFMILLLIFCVYKLALFKFDNKDYKISNFRFNKICISVYVLIFIFFIMYTRYIRFGYTLNLVEFYYKINSFFTKIPVLYTLNIVLMLIIGFLIIIHFKHLLNRELQKYFLYTYNKLKYKVFLQYIAENKSLESNYVHHYFFVRWADYLAGYWSYESVMSRFIYYNIQLPYKILKDVEKCPYWLDNPLEKFFYYLPFTFLIATGFYDCFYNSWILSLTLYYLPFYFIIHTYKTVSIFLRKTNVEMNKILYELYYEKDNVQYINCSQEEKNYISRYIKNNLRCLSHDTKFTEDALLLFEFPYQFIRYRRYVKESEFIYVNYDTGLVVDSRQCTDDGLDK